MILDENRLNRVVGSVVDFALWTALGALSLFFLTGCESAPHHEMVMGKSYQPGNVYQPEARLPEQVRRVAVLPMTFDDTVPNADTQVEPFAGVLRDELLRSKRFEVVRISPEELRHLTGKESWTAEEKLPPKFFELLRENFGCDAVLFDRLTAFRAYPPLAVGWSLKLMDSQTARVYWAIDEVYDGGDEQVSNGARRFQQGRALSNPMLADSRSILQSPLRFCQYVTSVSLATLPAR